MSRILGYRGVWGLIITSPTTTPEAEFNAMVPHGITIHSGRALVKDIVYESDEQFLSVHPEAFDAMPRAIAEIKSCRANYLVVGIGRNKGGKRGNDEFAREMEEMSGLRVATSGRAWKKALGVLNVKRIALITAYMPTSGPVGQAFFEECGYDIVTTKGLQFKSPQDDAAVPEKRLREAILEVNRPDVDAIISVGTNVPFVHLAAVAERWLEKPVLAVNAVLMWYALRDNGIADQIQGFGSLLANH